MKKYIYVQWWEDGVNLSEHRTIYERCHGPIPDGFHVHHRNEDTKDNDPDNLEALSPGDHKKLHSKRYIRRADGGWNKTCNSCGETKPLEAFPVRTGGTTHRRDCKPCWGKIQAARLTRRKAEDPEFLERQRQCVRNWYARKKLKEAVPTCSGP